MSEPYLDQTILKQLLTYEPETGLFVWKRRPEARENWNTRYAGKVAGFDWSPDGKTFYRSIRIFDWPFMGHRLAWLYMTGSWPAVVVDHADLDGLNNVWSNLRAATKMQNSGNTPLMKTNKTGFKGVCVSKKSGRFRANIVIAGRQTNLGHFSTAEEAHAAYVKAANEKYGVFARTA